MRLDPRPHIYVDTIYGREYAHGIEQPQMEEPVIIKSKNHKRTYNTTETEQEETKGTVNQDVMNIVHAIKYILQNPSVISG